MFRTRRGESARNLGAADMRHHNVGQQHVDRALVLLGQRDRIAAIFGFQHGVAELLQELADHPAQVGLIFRHQNRLHAGTRSLDRKLPPAAALAGAVDAREKDLQGRSPSRLAAHPDMTAAGPHNVVHHRQAETGSFILPLGGEKRLEDSALRIAASMPTPVSVTASIT